MGKFVIKKAATGTMFDLKAANGEIVATSQIYTAEESCKKGIHSVQTNAPMAPTEDQTKEGFETLKNPKFEIYKDKAEEFRFHLKATNGEIIAKSQGYTTKDSCEKGIASVKHNAPDAEIVHED